MTFGARSRRAPCVLAGGLDFKVAVLRRPCTPSEAHTTEDEYLLRERERERVLAMRKREVRRRPDRKDGNGRRFAQLVQDLFSRRSSR